MRGRAGLDALKTVLLFGLGAIGGAALELLARAEGVDRIVACQRDHEQGLHRTHVAAVGAVLQGHSKQIEFRPADASDVEGVARLLDEIRPDVILSSITVQSPRVLATAAVDPAVRARLREATFSIWLPWHLLPISQVTQAVIRAGISTAVVNVSFPDVVNPILWRRFGTGPTLGAGNVEMVAAVIIRHLCETRRISVEDVEVTIVASHAFLSPSSRAHIPSYLRVTAAGEDVTASLDLDYLVDRWGGLPWTRTTVSTAFAASATKNVLALLGEQPVRTTVTAPNGLPGGYPAFVSRRGVVLALPASLSEPEAVAINEAGNRFDGIERLDRDGSVVYTQATTAIMREFGYDCPVLRFDDLGARAEELRSLFARLSGGAQSMASGARP